MQSPSVSTKTYAEHACAGQLHGGAKRTKEGGLLTNLLQLQLPYALLNNMQAIL